MLPTLHSLLLLLLGAAPSQAAVSCPSVERYLDVLDRGGRCLTMPLLGAWADAERAGETACLSEALEARDLPHWAPTAPALPTGLPVAASKSTRSAYSIPNSLQSDNIVIWWGTSGGVRTSDIEDLIEAFEEGWTYHTEMLGLPVPEGCDFYKLNVYIGDSGSGTPSSYGAGGYSTTDRDGYPMIVIARDSLYDDEWAATTAVHELLHAMQSATGAFLDYSDGSDAAWYWEATATWVEGQVYPASYYYSVFLFGFAYIPYYPVHWFNYPDRDTIDEYHQYGAFIFPRYLSEIEPGDFHIVSDVWLEGGAWDDPLEVLDDLLDERGMDMRSIWADFIAHNAYWDYDDGSTYEYMLDYYDGYYTNESVSALHEGTGPSRLTEASWRKLPQRLGANYIYLESPSEGTLVAKVEGDDKGSSGGSATWYASLVLKRSSRSVEYVEIPFDGLTGTVRVEDASDYREACLVVGPWTPRWRSGEEFGFRYALYVTDGTADTGDTGEDSGDTGEDSGDTGEDTTDSGGTHDTGENPPGRKDKGGDGTCGCSGIPSRGDLPFGLLGLAGLLLRRRR
jgi:MYXO-CTERM domain-containing protein